MQANKTKSLIARSAIKKLEAMLPAVNRLRENAFTREDLSSIEGSFINWFQDKLQPGKALNVLRPGDRPTVEDFRVDQNQWATEYVFAAIELSELTERFLQYENAKQLEIASLESYIRRLLQKQASSSLWQGKAPKKIFNTSFHTYEGLSPKNLSATELSYDFESNQAMLPVIGETSIAIQGIRILNGSNGFTGNTNSAVSNQDNNPLFALNADPNDWFEYEVLDQGPVKLILALDLSGPTIINRLELSFVEQQGSNSVVIEDIEFTTPQGSINIHDLIGPQPASFWGFFNRASHTEFALNFLPVQASSVVIKLSSNTHGTVIDSNGVARKRYSIGFRNIALKAQKFDSKGSVASSLLSPGGGFLALPVLKIWPQDFNLYTPVYEYSLNQDGKWNKSDLNILTPENQSSILLQGNEDWFEWKLTLERKDKAFANATSFSIDSFVAPEIDTMLTSVSRFASPATVVLSGKPKDAKVFGLQPQLIQITDGQLSRYISGITTGVVQAINLPINVFDMYDFVDDVSEFNVGLRVQIGGEIFNVNEISDSPGVGEVTLGTDGKTLVINHEISGLEILIALPGEKLVFNQRPDGYYHSMRSLFDPDKDKIKIFYEPLATKAAGKVIPQGKKFIKLSDTDILSDSVKLVDLSDGSNWGARKTTYAGLTTAGDWFLDLQKGILYLFKPIESGVSIQLNYQSDSLIELSKEEFSVLIENTKPVGIKINSSAIQAREITERIGGARIFPGTVNDISRRDIRNGVIGDIVDTIENGYRFTYDSVLVGSFGFEGNSFLANGETPVEVSYIDGVSEFNGLKQSENEVTVYLEATGAGIVSFKLAARSLWKPEAGIVFGDSSVFKSKVALVSVSSTVGNYHVANDGLVTLNIGADNHLKPGISIHYLYVNPDFNPSDKFSINYSFGSLHTHTPIEDNSVISYKVARYKVWYDVAAEIKDIVYNSNNQTISVKTETMNEKNNLLRIVWNKSLGETTLEKYANYFSPLLFQVGHVLQ
jgi:hypothetical protein